MSVKRHPYLEASWLPTEPEVHHFTICPAEGRPYVVGPRELVWTATPGLGWTQAAPERLRRDDTVRIDRTQAAFVVNQVFAHFEDGTRQEVTQAPSRHITNPPRPGTVKDLRLASGQNGVMAFADVRLDGWVVSEFRLIYRGSDWSLQPPRYRNDRWRVAHRGLSGGPGGPSPAADRCQARVRRDAAENGREATAGTLIDFMQLPCNRAVNAIRLR